MMIIRTILAIMLAIIAPGQICLGAGSDITSSRGATTIPQWGVSAEIPKPFTRRLLPPSDSIPYSEVFISGDYAYTLEIVKIPAKSLASTFIEQSIQSDIKQASADEVKRWELESRQGELFKGITKPYHIIAPYPAALLKTLGGETGIQSVAMAPLNGESSPVLRIGIVSSTANKTDAENKAKALATFVVFTGKLNKIQPALVPQPIQVQPKPIVPTFLRKGEIELVGVVKSIDVVEKKLVLVVSQIRLPGSNMQKRDPAMPKNVSLLFMLPKGIKVGSRISVIGKNLGLGKPILADVISLISEN
jgi:hypothetical protein